ncbi:unnamed protein product [Ambrosiozyma monospora]|uniref:Unnamed protein product n=1 Tax=Ambrosiozyma monospora TaxID=43982 RepID=A0ACB5TA56_AMBMO|nr:unnamed protein product [Ambrosiozyma monospora]
MMIPLLMLKQKQTQGERNDLGLPPTPSVPPHPTNGSPPHTIPTSAGAPAGYGSTSGAGSTTPPMPKLPPKPKSPTVKRASVTETKKRTTTPTVTSRASSVVSGTGVCGAGHRHSSVTKQDVEQMMRNDEIISLAQKKAKFAISALNYEDVETAIKELQEALKLLKGE